MRDLNEEIDVYLDKISKDFKYIMESHYNFSNEEDYRDYRSLLVAMINENLIRKPMNNESSFQITSYGLKVIKDGGWKKHNELKEEKEKRKELKEVLDLKISKFQVKTKWLPYWVSLISLIISIFAFFRADESDLPEVNNEVETSSKMTDEKTDEKVEALKVSVSL